MAASEVPSILPHKTITIADPYDLTILVTEHKVKRNWAINDDLDEADVWTTSAPKATASMTVTKATLIEASDVFRAMFGRNFAEARSDTVTLKEEPSIKALEIWFRCLHGTLDALSLDDVSLTDLWHVIMAGDKYFLDRKLLQDWFSEWYAANRARIVTDVNRAREMLFPCYTFNHARGFHELTRFLAYNSHGHITEQNPTELHQMHLPPRVIQQLNAAKGRLRTILHRELFTTVSAVVQSASCACKETTVFNFLRELQCIKVWPLEDTLARATVHDILDRLNAFNMSPPSPEPGAGNNDEYCRDCSQDWGVVARLARAHTAEYFQGLCLDCMDQTKNVRRGGDRDDDYWVHHMTRRLYDFNCRVAHGEPSWYFSFMGRREPRGQFERED